MERSRYITTSEVLQEIRDSGMEIHEWGHAVDGTPMLGARTGGDKQPAIFITAGSHSGETAGVHGALELLRTLDTEHEVHVLPLRDPLGFSGPSRCMSVALGEDVKISNHEEALNLLKARGELLYEKETFRLYKLGTMGFAWDIPRPGLESFMSMHAQMLKLAREQQEVFRALLGQSVFLVHSMPDVEGTEDRRCWHGIVSTDGQWRHLNRFFDSSEAPTEVKAVKNALETVNPKLVCDLHEGPCKGFYRGGFRRPHTQQGEMTVLRMAQSFQGYLSERNYPMTTLDGWREEQEKHSRGYDPSWAQPVHGMPGMWWSDGTKRNEGMNLADFVTRKLVGIAYGTEAPAQQPLAMRIDGITHGMKRAIHAWAKQQSLP